MSDIPKSSDEKFGEVIRKSLEHRRREQARFLWPEVETDETDETEEENNDARD